MLERVRSTCRSPAMAEAGPSEELQTAVGTILDYGLTAFDPADRPARIPPALREQVSWAARRGIGLDIVLSCCCGGYALLIDCLLREADDALGPASLRALLRRVAATFDDLLGEVAEQHRSSTQALRRTSSERQAEEVRLLLGGVTAEAPGCTYYFDDWHVAAITSGPSARAVLRHLAESLRRKVLVVDGEAGAVWAWMGGRCGVTARDVLLAAESCWPNDLPLALGEAGEGLPGWRRSHRQALAALPIATRPKPRCLHYAEVAMLATALSDETLAAALRETYVLPLEVEGDTGATLRRTLLAYFAAGANASSAASVLGVSRKTVGTRLRLAEERLGRPIQVCAPELQTAIELVELGSDSHAHRR